MSHAAQQLAEASFGKESRQNQHVLFHLAAVHSAMRQNKEALSVLDECDRLASAIHGAGSLERVPICHAMAEVHEANGKRSDMEKALKALGRARELRLAALGEAHMSYAFSCVQEAALLVRFANEAIMMENSERGQRTEQAVDLTLAAHAAGPGRPVGGWTCDPRGRPGTARGL